MRRLDTPAKVQDFLERIPINFEEDGRNTLKSPLMTLRKKSAHCMEGALLGAYILSLHGYPSLLMHLKTTKSDMDHVVVPFRKDGKWGALSKTNHAVLRYREPVYKNIRELAMSYFHEYFLNTGKKTLRSYSAPLNLNIFEKGWETEERDLWGIDDELDRIKHHPIMTKSILKSLRLADDIEIKAGKITQW